MVRPSNKRNSGAGRSPMIGSRSVQLARLRQRGLRHVQQDDTAAKLGQKAGEPPGAGAEVENGRAGGQLQPLHQHGHVDQQRRRLVRLAEWLRQLMIPIGD